MSCSSQPINAYELLLLRKLVSLLTFPAGLITYEKFHVKFLQAGEELKVFSQCNSFKANGETCQNSRRLHSLLCYKHIKKPLSLTHYETDGELFKQKFSPDTAKITQTLSVSDKEFVKRIVNMADHYASLSLLSKTKKMQTFAPSLNLNPYVDFLTKRISSYPKDFNDHYVIEESYKKYRTHNPRYCYAIRKNYDFCKNLNKGERYCSKHQNPISRLGDVDEENDIKRIDDFLKNKKITKIVADVIEKNTTKYYPKCVKIIGTSTFRFKIDANTLLCTRI